MVHKCSGRQGLKKCRRDLKDSCSPRCTAGYPSPVSLTGAITEFDGKPIYARTADSTMVVPTMPCIFWLCDGHTNVEVTSSTGSMLYLLSYVNKKMQCAAIEMRRPGNQVWRWYNAMYVSSTMATWYFLGYHTMMRRPAVIAIRVALPPEAAAGKPDNPLAALAPPASEPEDAL